MISKLTRSFLVSAFSIVVLSGCSKPQNEHSERPQIDDELRRRVTELESERDELERSRDAATKSGGQKAEDIMKSAKQSQDEATRLLAVTESQKQLLTELVSNLEAYIVQISVMNDDGTDSPRNGQIRSLRNRARDTWDYLNQNFPDRKKVRLPGPL